MLDYGLPPSRPGRALDLRALDQVIDFPARDMTITVQSGITLSALETILAKENLSLPIDVSRPGLSTLGGAIATNASGSRRLGYGTLRDYVIGISVVNDEGKEIKAGGRVVKNVAGYDLCKLCVGSLGTLGVITQVTLKLKPMPEERAIVLIPCRSDPAEVLLNLLHESRTRPACIDLLNPGRAQYIKRNSHVDLPEEQWTLVVGYEGNRCAVTGQVQQIILELGREYVCGLDVHIGEAVRPIWQALALRPTPAESTLTLKANVLPSATARICREFASEGLAIHAHAGSGIIYGFGPARLVIEDCRTLLLKWQELGRSAGGNAIAMRCPAAWKSSLPIWGAPREDAWLMQTVKQKLDPQAIFNPGRFIAAI